MHKENIKISIPEIIDLMVERKNVSKKTADEFIRVLISTIEDALLSGDFVRVKGFGTFKPQWNEARRGVDTNTGNEIIIPGFYRVVFSPENDLKSLINEPFAHLETIVLSDSDSESSKKTIESALEEESIGIKDDSNLTFFSSQAAEIKEILSDINALSEKNKPSHEEEKPVEKDAEKVEKRVEDADKDIEEAPQETIKPAESEYDEEDYFDDTKQDDEEAELKLIQEKTKKEETVFTESPVQEFPIINKIEPEPEEDDFNIIRDVSVLYPAVSAIEEERASIDVTPEVTEVVDTEEVDNQNEGDAEMEDVAAEGDGVHGLPEDEISKEPEDAEEDDLFEGELETKSEKEVESDEITEERVEAVDETIPLVAPSVGASEPLIEKEIREDSTPQAANDDVAEETISEEADYIEQERVERRKKLITTAFVIGSVAIIGFAIYFSLPIISKIIKEKKAQERFDYIADSIAGLEKINFIRDSIYSNSIVDSAATDSLKKDTVVATPETVVEAESPAQAQEVQAEKKAESAKSGTNPYTEPRSYKSFIATEKMVIGTSLTKFAKKYYGNATYWVYIYEANRDKISDPNNVPTGIAVKIPNVNPVLVDPQNRESMNYALKLQTQYLR